MIKHSLMTLDPLHLAFGDTDYELAVTRNMLSRVPDDCFDWQPHEKSWTMGKLASHIVDLLWWQVVTLEEDGVDLAQPWPQTEATSQKALMASFDEKERQLRKVLDRTTLDTLGEPWTLSYGDQTYFTEPKATVLRRFGISHLIHHRAQLSIYLRMNNVPLPPSYGPSADES
ncbi:MAG: DinB family protein [Bacteroidetes bacterium]|nr:DinB family protein [Bacteroidota bacterium]